MMLNHAATVVSDLEASLRYSWRQFLSAQELAKPGFMTLCAIRESGEIVDFEWDYVNAAAARTFLETPDRMVGKRLLGSLPAREGLAAVFAHYRQVVDGLAPHTFQHEHTGNGIDDSIRHVVTRLGDGVAVTLSNPTAAIRADALRVELTRHQKHLQQQAHDDRLRERAARRSARSLQEVGRTRDPAETPLFSGIDLRVPQPAVPVIGETVRWRFFRAWTRQLSGLAMSANASR